jgi:predicted NBD/HSP70 family sugar kinase
MTLTDGRRPGNRAVAADHVSLRRNNLSVVLRHVRDLGPRSRARIAAETGLNKATVSSLVAELVERGLLREGSADASRALGRPGQLVELDGTGVCGVGAEINVDYLAVTALDLAGTVVHEKRVPVDVAHLDPGTTLDRVAELIQEALVAVDTHGGQVAGVTLAVPGLVQDGTGDLKLAPNLGWGELSVARELRLRLGEAQYPLHVDNEANLAALAAYAELRGSDEALHDLVLLTGAVGVGGGVVAGGHLLRGGHGFSGEVGHMPVAPPGQACGCGRTGCWETVVGLTALLRKATDRDDPVRDPSLDVEQRLAGITRRAEAGDARTLSALKDVGTWLGIGGAILVNILNPDVLVLGGYFAVLGPWLKEPLEKAIRERVIAPNGGGCRVVRSELGFAAAVRGGAQISLDQVFVDPTRIGATP